MINQFVFVVYELNLSSKDEFVLIDSAGTVFLDEGSKNESDEDEQIVQRS